MKALLLAFLTLPLSAGAQIISTVAGNGSLTYSRDSIAATAASFYYPMGVAVDAAGNIYIADALHAVVRKVNTAGIITTIAGSGTTGFGGDGGPAANDSAKLNSPAGLTVDAIGNLFIADAGNSRVRKVDQFGNISTVAGGGGSTAEGCPATAYGLAAPAGLAFDNLGNLYISDDGRIHKVTPAGIITTIAGYGANGYGGDGGAATMALMSDPQGLAVDRLGNVYVADKDNFRIRKIDALSGIITTIAGNGDGATGGYSAFSGDNGPATAASLNFPTGVVVGADNTLYIADRNNNRIRRVDGSGIITTIAGNNTSGFSGDGGPAINAELSAPGSVAIDVNGNLYIADELNSRIRKIVGLGTFSAVNNVVAKSSIVIYPNPATDNINITGLAPFDHINLYDALGRAVYTSITASDQHSINVKQLIAGVYFLEVTSSGVRKGKFSLVKG